MFGPLFIWEFLFRSKSLLKLIKHIKHIAFTNELLCSFPFSLQVYVFFLQKVEILTILYAEIMLSSDMKIKNLFGEIISLIDKS